VSPSVVFVCTGNICRSPIAEKVFVHELDRAGLGGKVEVSSAGTGPWHVGSPADDRAAAILREHGYDDAHVARQVDAGQLASDLVLALDPSHLKDLRRMVDDPSRVRLLRSFDPASPEGAGVPDPYYGENDGFLDVLRMIEAAMPGLLEWVRERV
jgi:protein-tyrosine phosphatase